MFTYVLGLERVAFYILNWFLFCSQDTTKSLYLRYKLIFIFFIIFKYTIVAYLLL